jgi:hypothetical protein
MRLKNADLPKDPATAKDIAKMEAAGKATGLPDIVTSLWFNRPTLKVNDKWLICARQKGIYVFLCPLPEKEALIGASPDLYFDTDHHAGSAAVLVYADKISMKDLALRITRAWNIQTSKGSQRKPKLKARGKARVASSIVRKRVSSKGRSA